MQTPGHQKQPLDIRVSKIDDDFNRSPLVNYQQFENFLSVQKPQTYRELDLEDNTLQLDP